MGHPRRVPAEIRNVSFPVSARGYDRRSVDVYVIRRPVLVIRCERAGSGVGAMVFGSAPGPLIIVCASFGRDQHLHRQTLWLRSVAGLLPQRHAASVCR